MATTNPSRLSRFHRAARWYASHGWWVFPCGSRGKNPLTTHGLLDATTDPDGIDRWWTRWRGASVGVATGQASGIFAVDVDPRHGGEYTLAALEAQHGPLPETVEALTGGGGRHLLFAHPGAPTAIKTNAGSALGAGLDVRGDGGYIVVAPSVHASGTRYAWAEGRGPDERSPAEAPEWLLDLVTAAPREAHTGDTGDRQIPEGRRNDTLFRDGCAMRRRGAPFEAILSALLATNELCCRPPLPVSEVTAIAESAAKYDPTVGQDQDPRGGRSDTHNSSNSFNSSSLPWPTLDPMALYGLAGDVIRAIGPHTEADEAGLLLQTLVAFGNVIGRQPHCMAEADYHGLNEFAVLVGATSKGRKGSAAGHIRRLFSRVDPPWVEGRIQAGLSSGEGLIWAVRDPIVRREAIREKGRPTGEYEDVVADHGVDDKRLLVFEAELSSTLRVIGRDGNTLSAIIRQAWDDGTLRVLTKNSPAVATAAHISIVGHITRDELLRYLDSTEAGNGFGNRFLWCCVRRSKALPEGGNLRDGELTTLVMRLKRAVDAARRVGVIVRDEDGRAVWREVYAELSEGAPGLLGAMTSRAEAHVMRLSAIYALMDESPVVKPDHLLAALAMWKYCEDSARYIFGESLGDPLADEILRLLRASVNGMTKTEISNHFGRNKSSAQLSRALNMLEQQGLARCETQETGGRTAQVWRATGSTN